MFVLTLAGVSATAILAAEVAPSGTPAAAPMAESQPFVRDWKPAPFPASVSNGTNKGYAVIRFVVDERGTVSQARVLKADQPAFGDAALAAVKQWTFTPGVDNGKVTAMCMDVRVDFDRAAPIGAGAPLPGTMQPKLVRRTNAELEDGPLGEYPPTLVGRGLPGEVFYRCTVDPEGHAVGLRVLRASHADFVLPALESAVGWKFKPATQGDLKIPAELVGQVSYGDTKTPPRSQVLAVNGMAAPDGSQPEAVPQPVAMADPVWPIDRLLKGEGGSANVQFTVGPNGVVRDIQVRDATQPEFGAAVAAAIEGWQFEPGMVHGKSVDVTLVKHAEFKAVPLDAKPDSDDWLARLVALARANAIAGGRGLDRRLAPIYQVPPVRPSSLADGEKGSATIQFVIDRDGRARLPRVVSASSEAVGWAAATAVSQWVFGAPTRGGKPTEVLVSIPIQF